MQLRFANDLDGPGVMVKVRVTVAVVAIVVVVAVVTIVGMVRVVRMMGMMGFVRAALEGKLNQTSNPRPDLFVMVSIPLLMVIGTTRPVAPAG